MDWNTLIIGGIVGALIAIPFTIVYDLFLKSWVKSVYSKSIFSSKQKRINSVVEKYRKVKSIRANPTLMSLSHIKGLFFGIVQITLLLFFVATFSLLPIITNYDESVNELFALFLVPLLLGTMFGISFLSDFILEIDGVLNFEDYKEQTIKKLIKLGGNPEDLDKEDTKE